MEKKKIVITLSRVFPTTHSRKGQPTGFKEKLASGCKLHTIRGNFDQWNAIAEKMQRGGYCLSIRQWSGRPYNSPQVEIASLDQPIGIQRIELHYHSENDTITARIDAREWIDADCYEIAKNDGLNTTDFKEWFFGRHPKGDKVFTASSSISRIFGIDMRHQESIIQQTCVRWFRMKYPQLALLLFAVPNGGARLRSEAAIMKAEGTMKGVADLLLLFPAKRFHGLCIEMKTPTGRQQPSQKAWQERAEWAGYKYVICRSFDEFMAEIDAYLK